ncbi:unnamed protein product [Merluccius merluccius]
MPLWVKVSGVYIQSEPASNGGLITTRLNETLSLTCRHAAAGQSDRELVWLRNGALVKLAENNKGDRSAICVTPVTLEDNGATFTCRLQENATFKASVTLNVTYAPRSTESEDVFLEEQDALVLQCDMKANPPVSVSWLYNGTLLDQSAGKVVVTSDGLTSTLTVDRVERDLHAGTYQCRTESTLYGTGGGTFKVMVSVRTSLKLPLMPMMAGMVVVFLTTLLAIVSRRKKIAQMFSSRVTTDQLSMTSSMMSGYGKAMVGVWRAHTALDESDEAEGSPEAPDRFRKLRSSSSLNSLRMSLRKRLPLRSVQTNSLPENPTWETLQEPAKPSAMCKLARGARQSVGGVYQRLQRTREARQEECLVSTPGPVGEPEEGAASTSDTPKRTPGRPVAMAAMPTPRRTPRASATPRRTPGSGRRSAKKGTPKGDDVRGVKARGGRRQLVRMAALRSPFASPNTQNQRRKFDQDLESVSSGLKRLKHLSRAFDSFIGRDDRTNGVERAGGAIMRKLDPNGKLSRSNLTRRATKLSHTLGDWAT